jgi:hypothetical protein
MEVIGKKSKAQHVADEEIEEYYGVLQQHRTVGHFDFMKAHFPTDESGRWDER